MTVYLRAPGAPTLDLAVTVVGWGEIARPGRNAVYDVVGSPLPVVTTEVHSSRRVTVQLYTTTVTQRDELDDLLRSGRTLGLDTPAGLPLPSMRVTVGDYSMTRVGNRNSTVHTFAVPLTEVGTTPVIPGLAPADLGPLTSRAVAHTSRRGTAAAPLGALTGQGHNP